MNIKNFRNILNKIYILFFIYFILMFSSITVRSAYLAPVNVDNEECFDIYDILNIKNGTFEDKNDLIFGKGKIFYINENLLSVYENSIVYKINEKYEPIEPTTFSSNGYEINLPKVKKININQEPFYFNKKQISNYFSLDIESQGILYEKVEEENIPEGITLSFLEENITSLGYEYIGNGIYQYIENDLINNQIYFYNEELKIQWFNNTSQDIINLVIQSLYPNSYSNIIDNLMFNDGVYDNRYFKSTVYENYIEFEIKDNFNSENI